MITDLTKRILTLSQLKGIGEARLRQLVDTPDFAKVSVSALASAHPALEKALQLSTAWDVARTAAERDIAAADAAGACIVSPHDDGYPALLRDAQMHPMILYVKGHSPNAAEKSVAIIGTRQPTAHGAIITRRLTAVFAERGWSIVSGLALGCDAIAHDTALDCKGHTVAVLAHGLHTVAPRQHARLAAKILDAGGQLVSAYPFGKEPIPAYFAERDAVQAGMARAVVMIQSDLEGGSLHATRAALRYGRILAVPAATQRDLDNHEPKCGANRILADGAEREKMTLLHCAAAHLENLIILRSKDDYAQLFARVESGVRVESAAQFGGANAA